jgi:hypothetical protein
VPDPHIVPGLGPYPAQVYELLDRFLNGKDIPRDLYPYFAVAQALGLMSAGIVRVTQLGVTALELRPAPEPKRAIAGVGEAEANVLEALGDSVLSGPDLAAKAGYAYGYCRRLLGRMVRKGLLCKGRGGYRRCDMV